MPDPTGLNAILASVSIEAEPLVTAIIEAFDCDHEKVLEFVLLIDANMADWDFTKALAKATKKLMKELAVADV